MYWTNECLYFHKNGYHNFDNAWDYYFLPVSKLKYKQNDKIYKVYKAPDNFEIPYGINCYNDYFHKTLKYEMHKIIKEYIKLQPHIENKLNKFYEDNLKGYSLIGIHLRGTDKIYEAKWVDPKKMLYYAKDSSKIFKDKKFKYFIATDEEKLLSLAKSILKKNVMYYPSHRSVDKEPIHFSKKVYPPILGEEILIEVLLLSKCDLFIHTRSNVATSVMIFNPNIRDIYFPN